MFISTQVDVGGDGVSGGSMGFKGGSIGGRQSCIWVQFVGWGGMGRWAAMKIQFCLCILVLW